MRRVAPRRDQQLEQVVEGGRVALPRTHDGQELPQVRPEERRGERGLARCERAQVAVALTRPRSRMMKTMLAPIKAQNVKLAYREGCIISYVKSRNTKIFATLKARR